MKPSVLAALLLASPLLTSSACTSLDDAQPLPDDPGGKADGYTATDDANFLNCWDFTFFYNVVQVEQVDDLVEVHLQGGLVTMPGFSFSGEGWNDRVYSWSYPADQCTWSASDPRLVSCTGTTLVSATPNSGQDAAEELEMTIELNTHRTLRETAAGDMFSSIELSVASFGLAGQPIVLNFPIGPEGGQTDSCSSDPDSPVFDLH